MNFFNFNNCFALKNIPTSYHCISFFSMLNLNMYLNYKCNLYYNELIYIFIHDLRNKSGIMMMNRS